MNAEPQPGTPGSKSVAEAERRGRFADRPTRFRWPAWRDILLRVKAEMAEDHLDIVAAGVAFYALLALFPAMAALVSLYGIAADPADVARHLQALGGILPEQSWQQINAQLEALTGADERGLTLAAGLSILLLIWSASKGTKSIMAALNIVYDERDKRGFVVTNLIGLLLALGAILMVVLWVVIIAVLPIVFGFVGLGDTLRSVLDILRWPLLGLLFIAALAVLYRVGPDRRPARWRWVSTGATVSLVLWLFVSLGFSWYVANFGSYDKTYGSIGAIVVLMLWLYFSAYVILLGAELNAEIERQTSVDTTTGKARPMGERGATVADMVGERPAGLFS